MRKHQENIVEGEGGLIKLDGPPKDGVFVTLGPKVVVKAPKPKRKAKEADHGASD